MSFRLGLACFLVGSVLLGSSCASDTSDEHGITDIPGCTINSDCDRPLICAFERCHPQCDEDRDCEILGTKCVKSESGPGVCLYPGEGECGQSGDCPGELVCSEGKCSGGCEVKSDCVEQQTCASGLCEDLPEGSGGNAGQAGAGGMSGAGGVGGISGSGGIAGSSASGGAGGTGGVSGAGGTGGVGGVGGTGGVAGNGGVSGADGGAGTSGVGGMDGGTTLPAPIAYWPLDAIGGALVDSIGDAHGEYKGGTIDASGQVGDAIRFNLPPATKDYAVVDSHAALVSPTAIAVRVWIKPAVVLGSNAGYRAIVNSAGFQLYYNAGKLVFRIYPLGGAFTEQSADITFAVNQWAHIAASYDLNNGDVLRLFVDGVEVATPKPGPQSIQNMLAPLAVGSRNALSAQDVFLGSIDELALYTQGLGLAEVTALYNAGSSGQSVTACSGCLQPAALWTFDDDPNPVVSDVVGSSHGKNVSAAVPVAGRVGTGLEFVEVGDHVNVPNQLALNPTAALTIALWIRPAVTLSGDSLSKYDFFVKEYSGAGFALQAGYATGFRALIGGGIAKASGKTWAPGVWHHLAGTWDGSYVRLYIDGQFADEKSKSTPLAPYTGDLLIGGTGDGTDGWFLGTVDEVALWDVALSAAEIQKLYDLGNQGLPLY